MDPRARGQLGARDAAQRGGAAAGGSPGKLAAAGLPPAQASGWPVGNHLAPTTINPWQAPGLLCLLIAEMGLGAAPHGTEHGTDGCRTTWNTTGHSLRAGQLRKKGHD